MNITITIPLDNVDKNTLGSIFLKVHEISELAEGNIVDEASAPKPTISRKPAAKKTAAKKSAAKGPAKAEDDPMFGDGAGEQVTIDELKTHAHAWIEQNSMAGMKKILHEEFKLTQLAKMDPGDYPRFMQLIALEDGDVPF